MSFLLGLLSLFLCNIVSAQNSGFLTTKFLKDSIEVGEGSFQFNNINLQNTSSKQLSLTLTFNTPSYISVLSQKQITVTLQPGEQQIVPIRLTVNNKPPSEFGWQPFTIDIIDAANGVNHAASFKVRPKLSKKWKAALTQSTLIIPGDTKTIKFYVRIDNTGNVNDTYKFDFKTQLPLSVAKNYSVTINKGESRVIDIAIKFSTAEIAAFKKEEIIIHIENGEGDKKMLVQTISKIANVYTENADRWQKVPLTAEMHSLNAFSDNPLYFGRLYGTYFIKPGEHISLQLQSPNFYSNATSYTQIATAIYNTKQWELTAGTMFEFNNFPINGDGVKVKYKKKTDNWYELQYVHGRFTKTDQFSVRALQPLDSNYTFTLTSNNFVNIDHTANTNSYLTQQRVQWNINKETRVYAEAGIGLEKINKARLDTSLPASFAGVHFERTGIRWQALASIVTYSPSFPGLNKGFTQYQHDVKWNYRKWTIGSFVTIDRHQPNLITDTSVTKIFNYHNTEISGRLGWMHKNISFTILPGIYQQKQDSINSFRANMAKLTAQLFFAFGKNWQGSLFANLSSTKIEGYKQPLGNIASSYYILSIQNKNFGLFTRYDDGAYYYFELREQILRNLKHSRLQVTPFFDFYFKKLNLSFKNQFNFSLTKPNNEKFLFMLNNLLWNVPSKKISVGLNVNSDLQHGNNNTVNVYFKKEFRMPIYPKKGYKNVKLVLFKDIDKNNQKDEGDGPVQNARLLIARELVESDTKGNVHIKNFSGSSLDLDLSTINNLVGWVPVQGYRQKIPVVSKDETIYIAFKEGRVITGKLLLDKDDKSDVMMDLAAIRITAAAKDGTIYSTLTNFEGEFFLNLPEDIYIISVNQNAIDDKFRAVDPVRTIDLINNKSMNVEFIIRQKRRNINIKKD